MKSLLLLSFLIGCASTQPIITNQESFPSIDSLNKYGMMVVYRGYGTDGLLSDSKKYQADLIIINNGFTIFIKKIDSIKPVEIDYVRELAKQRK